ncbi:MULTISPECIES: glycine betaine ABC transporter substrate-binding protein [unclassified Carboxylicivirga]|uniref:glycine betaine ABC transporter substrate-binding protein n=1 Tax=Carboxylicivirga TaxID=1628153 RepID=UPI003D3345E6
MSNKKEDQKKQINIAYVDGWAEGIAMTAITKEILTQKGYEVKMQTAALDLIFASMANGDTDVFMDVWLPVSQGKKVAKFKDEIESLGVNFDNAKIGLVVPQYVNISSVDELNQHADKFDDRIVGIEKGAGITIKTNEAIEAYDLSLEQMNASGVAMLAELQKAIQANKWVVVTGWAPHWKFGRYDLKFLDDPKGIFGEAQNIETYARKGFKEEDPFAAKYFSNFSLSEAQLSNLLVVMEDANDLEAGAKKWVAQNKDLVATWLK